MTTLITTNGVAADITASVAATIAAMVSATIAPCVHRVESSGTRGLR